MPAFRYFRVAARAASARSAAKYSTLVFRNVMVENITKPTRPANANLDVDQAYKAEYTYINNVVENHIDAMP